jgi:serine phosphatase RsbU (regulator of sigma subunit)
MSPKEPKDTQSFQAQAEKAASLGDWKTAAEYYSRSAEQRASELALINSVQEGLSSKLDMQGIYDLIGDKLRDTFNAQIVMISQYDHQTNMIFHHYAIERGQHLHIPDWQPVDSSRGTIIRTRKPFMINQEDIIRVVNAGKMAVVPGTELPKTWMGVPMLVGNNVVGIVSLQHIDKENAYSKSEIELLMTLTNSMSMSLENARLFNETERLLKLVEGELNIARQTQRSILPLRVPHRHHYDFGSLIAPARAVGGDFYDFIYLDRDRLSLVIGDVSDKGLPAALFMALTFSLLRAETELSHDPYEILINVNRYLLKMNASGMFVTVLYGILDCRTGEFTYTRAGHLLPIILTPDGKKLKINMDPGQPLGLFADIKLDLQTVVIPPGGLALLYSDGLNEAIDPQGNEFGYDRIINLLISHREKSSKIICSKLWEAVKIHSGNLPHQDDFVTVIIKRDPTDGV